MKMAFFISIARVLVLLILSPPLINHQAKNFAVADYKLIQTLCHISDTPETCMKCVQSSKGAVQADVVGIATVIVDCIKDEAHRLLVHMRKLASKSHGEFKSICKRCAKEYGNHIAKKELISTQHALKNHKYDNAELSVARALSLDYKCHLDLLEYHDKVPSDVFNHMKLYEELSEVASRIIEKL